MGNRLPAQKRLLGKCLQRKVQHHKREGNLQIKNEPAYFANERLQGSRRGNTGTDNYSKNRIQNVFVFLFAGWPSHDIGKYLKHGIVESPLKQYFCLRIQVFRPSASRQAKFPTIFRFSGQIV